MLLRNGRRRVQVFKIDSKFDQRIFTPSRTRRHEEKDERSAWHQNREPGRSRAQASLADAPPLLDKCCTQVVHIDPRQAWFRMTFLMSNIMAFSRYVILAFRARGGARRTGAALPTVRRLQALLTSAIQTSPPLWLRQMSFCSSNITRGIDDPHLGLCVSRVWY